MTPSSLARELPAARVRPRCRSKLLVLACALVSPVAAAAQDRIVVEGRVVAEDTGKPLPGARILLSQDQTSTRTDALGRFEINVPSTQPWFFVAKPGYVQMPARVEKGGRNLMVRLPRGGALTVHVFNPEGEPARASVRLSRGGEKPTSGGTVPTDDRGQARVANMRAGRYTVSVVGTAAVRVKRPPRELSDKERVRLRDEIERASKDASPGASSDIDVRAGRESALYLVGVSPSRAGSKLDFSGAGPEKRTASVEGRVVDAPGSEITGTVLDEFGGPVERAMMQLLRLSVDGEGRTRLIRVGVGQSDDRGRYRIPGVTPGAYAVLTQGESSSQGETYLFYPGVVSLEAARMVEVAAGRDVTGIDFRLNPDLGQPVVGTLAPYGGGTGAMAELTGTDARGVQMERRTTRITRTGTFVFLNVAPGRYTVSLVTAPGLLPVAVQIEVGDTPPDHVLLRITQGLSAPPR